MKEGKLGIDDWVLLIVFISIIIYACVNLTPAHSQTNAAANQIEINAQVSYGLGWQANTNLLNYIEPGTTTALFANSTTVFIPPNTIDQQINLATLFPNINTAVLWGVADISNPGQPFSLGMAAGGARYAIAAGGFQINRVAGSAPVLYVTMRALPLIVF